MGTDDSMINSRTDEDELNFTVSFTPERVKHNNSDKDKDKGRKGSNQDREKKKGQSVYCLCNSFPLKTSYCDGQID